MLQVQLHEKFTHGTQWISEVQKPQVYHCCCGFFFSNSVKSTIILLTGEKEQQKAFLYISVFFSYTVLLFLKFEWNVHLSIFNSSWLPKLILIMTICLTHYSNSFSILCMFLKTSLKRCCSPLHCKAIKKMYSHYFILRLFQQLRLHCSIWNMETSAAETPI